MGLALLGAGGQARESAAYCHEVGLDVEVVVVQQGFEGPAHSSHSAPLVTFDALTAQHLELPALTAVGSPDLRRRLVAQWPGRQFAILVAAGAWVAADADQGPGTTIAPNAVVNVGARLGDHVLVNVGAVVSHDARIADFVTVGPGCLLGGGVVVEDDAYLGIGAVVRDNVTVGHGAVVGAGAVVVHDVPAGTTVVGVPARAIEVVR
jgi:sugar O-acyltransferase (sialic acid O-acetyltransferase NeuD family)